MQGREEHSKWLPPPLGFTSDHEDPPYFVDDPEHVWFLVDSQEKLTELRSKKALLFEATSRKEKQDLVMEWGHLFNSVDEIANECIDRLWDAEDRAERALAKLDGRTRMLLNTMAKISHTKSTMNATPFAHEPVVPSSQIPPSAGATKTTTTDAASVAALETRNRALEQECFKFHKQINDTMQQMKDLEETDKKIIQSLRNQNLELSKRLELAMPNPSERLRDRQQQVVPHPPLKQPIHLPDPRRKSIVAKERDFPLATSPTSACDHDSSPADFHPLVPIDKHSTTAVPKIVVNSESFKGSLQRPRKSVSIRDSVILQHFSADGEPERDEQTDRQERERIFQRKRAIANFQVLVRKVQLANVQARMARAQEQQTTTISERKNNDNVVTLEHFMEYLTRMEERRKQLLEKWEKRRQQILDQRERELTHLLKLDFHSQNSAPNVAATMSASEKRPLFVAPSTSHSLLPVLPVPSSTNNSQPSPPKSSGRTSRARTAAALPSRSHSVSVSPLPPVWETVRPTTTRQPETAVVTTTPVTTTASSKSGLGRFNIFKRKSVVVKEKPPVLVVSGQSTAEPWPPTRNVAHRTEKTPTTSQIGYPFDAVPQELSGLVQNDPRAVMLMFLDRYGQENNTTLVRS